MTGHLGDVVALPLDQVHASRNNPRENLTDIDELAASITEVGLIQPIVVQVIPGQAGYQVVAGHRRLAAFRKLGRATIPAIRRRDMLPDEELLTMLVENGQRAGLDPIEEARALKKLKGEPGCSNAELGTKVGRSTHWINDRLQLLQLPLAEQEEVRAGHYTLTHATNVLRAQRAAARRREQPTARPVGRPRGARTRPYFGDTHPLAGAVRARCDHRGTPKVGGVGCGPCWESVIRIDEHVVHPDQEAHAS